MDKIEQNWTLSSVHKLDTIHKVGQHGQKQTKVGQKLTKLDKMNKLDIMDKIEGSDRTVQIKYVETLENQEDLKNVV